MSGPGEQLPLPWEQGTGQERKEAALQSHENKRREVLGYIRSSLRDLFNRRAEARYRRGELVPVFVTADDASRYFEEWMASNPGHRISRAFLGAVFREEGWAPIGEFPDHPSTQPKNHGRLLLRWTYHAPGA